jgi:Nucleoside 2-deoxyribosyltransferase like
MAHFIKPPTPIVFDTSLPSVFLAGSIAMGRAEQWQAEFERAFADEPVVILNPRRDQWDASWRQSIDNPQFRQQVEWELEGQERADLIAFYFASQTQAPITLLELGLSARGGKAIVCCPHGFWRRGNVEVVCGRYGIAMVADLAQLIEAVRKAVHSKYPARILRPE